MRIARPIAFLFIMALALALLHASSLDVFAQTDCVQSLNSVAVEGTWNGDCLSRNREDAYARYYTFSILRQSDVSITLESETDPYVFLLSGIGAEADYLAENDDIDAGSRNFNSRVTRTLEPGDYTIEATTYDAEAIGEFTLTVAGIGALDDRAALTAFYHATDGPNWRNSDNWLTDAPLSEWYGVYNTNADGRVTDLQLSSNYLSGQIPPDLGNLEELQVLSISGNQLTDIIPPELGKLVNLKHLRLDHNKLSGELPRTLTELTLLSGLYFGDNAGLCAPNTDEAFMAWLRGISEADGATCSPLPPSDERDLDGLKALYDATDGDNWSRRDNWFTDAPLAEWYGVTIDFDGRVSELNFDYNLLTGELPPELSNLTNLKRLSLGVNRLTGEIPHQLGELTNLIRIGLSSNQLAGSIPAELGNLTNLTGLYLGANLLAGDIPAELGRLTNLRVLYLDGNELTLSNEALSGISNLVNLEALGLANNRLSGEIPAEFSNLEKLVQLRLSNNQLTGEIPLELIRLANMELLQLGRNQLTGVIPSELGGLSNLEILELNENRLTGQIPDRLGDLTLLESLHLDSNQLTGDIPSALSDLTELDELYLAGNQLTGCIPALGDVKGNDFDELGLPFCVDTNPTPTVPDCVDQLPDDISVAGTWSTDCTSDIDAPSGRGDRYAKFYTFTLYAESDVTITLSSDEDAFLYLRTGTSTDGAALHENDDYNYPASTDSRIEETLEAGTYTIEATTYAAGVTGDFILTVNGIGPLDDRAALTALYNATGGDDWDDNDNWLTDAPLDEWYGVDTDEEGRVIVLDLAGNDLVGHIPPELGELSELEVLELNSNLLTGTLPPELGKLSELEHVEIC